MNLLHYQAAFSLLVIIFSSIPFYSQSQHHNQNQFLPAIIPPSPDAAALGKYGNTPVGLHTGIPGINIPLYTIKSKMLEVPISLSYHASGIKVDEMASWVGLGWSLNAGGVITRSVVGLPDDNGGFWTTKVKSAAQITSNDIDYVRGVANGQVDGESDYYFYNFNGYAGKFIYDHNKAPFLIPVSPIRIKYNDQGWFEITDEMGIFYKFAAIEDMSSGPAGSVRTTFKSSFYLSEIVSADGSDTIRLRYTSDEVYFDNQDTYIETAGIQCGSGGPINPYHTSGNGRSTREIHPIRLMEIIFSNGKVEFVKDLSRADAPGSRLEEIKVYSKEYNGSYTLRKSFSMGEGYFVSGAGIGESNNRLKLTEVAEKDNQGKTIKRHSFAYNDSTMLPHRSSLAQDWWGYYNGETENKSLIGRETINFVGRPYTIGNANREPNETAMKACMLARIVYPTGGYTEFDYESHYFSGIGKANRKIQASSGELGNTTDLLEQTVVFTSATAGWAKVITSCSNVTDANPFFSRVTLRMQSDGQYLLNHIYDPYTYKPYNDRLDKDFQVYLNAGATYELKVMSKGKSTSPSLGGAAFAMASVLWDEIVPEMKTMAGSLRVKEIRDFDSPEAVPLTKKYNYGIAENGKGVLLIPPDGLSSSKQEIDTELWHRDSSNPLAGCNFLCRSTKLLISGRTILELSTLNGSPVVYPEVTVYESRASVPNGKQVFKFDVQEDRFMGTPKAYNNGRFQINESWRGGDEVWNGVFKGNNHNPIKETSSTYSILSNREAKGTKIGWKVDIYEGDCYPPIPDINHFYFFDYPIQSGIKKLTSSKETQKGTTDSLNGISTQTEYKYENLGDQHQQLTRQISINSQGDTLETKYWYPANYGSVENVPALLSKNIIAAPIKIEQHRNRKIINGTVNRLNVDGKPYEKYAFESGMPQIPPLHQENAIVPKDYVKKVDIAYDAITKNIQKVQLSDHINTTYLWGYNNTYPVAKVDNATVAEVAATSFEPNNKGNWSYDGTVFNDIKSKTGTYFYKMGGGNITKNLEPGKYRLEYWAKGVVDLSGGTITTLRTAPAITDGWVFYEHEVNITNPTVLSLSGTTFTFIDELRLYPATAQMTTYTYDPLLGMTSSTDANNITTYYEYDAFGRLKLVKDEKGKIIRQLEYKYAGQQH